MISFLTGKLVSKNPMSVIVEVGGVGFFVHIPLSSYQPIQDMGENVRIWTHLYVREDVMALYGFATEAERELFELLISVSGIGPPIALRILSGVLIADFKRLVSSGDDRGLMRIKGVGQKLALRLILELKDRIAGISVGPDAGDTVKGEALDLLEEATSALIGLGSSPLQARRVVTQVIRDGDDGMPVEEVIRRALRGI